MCLTERIFGIEIYLRRSTIGKQSIELNVKQWLTAKSPYIDTQLEIETMKAVPTPRFDVGAKVLAAQLL